MAKINVWQVNDNVVRRPRRHTAGNNRSLAGEVRYIHKSVGKKDVQVKRTL